MGIDVTLPALKARLTENRLDVLGGFAVRPGETGFPQGTRTLLMLGPKEPGFWAHLMAQPEWAEYEKDEASDPVDHWSRRVIGRIACDLGAKALFPFGGAPYHPFHQWALRTGQVWDSPVRLLVHAGQGLLVSFRGALALKTAIDFPPPAARPCDVCPAPCLTACPAGALSGTGYDVPACHDFLDQPAGLDCMTGGCLVRRACPVSQSYARLPEQSAYHMRQFHR
jgi:epoxyqueuosine reductase